jgi:hypothetical protein
MIMNNHMKLWCDDNVNRLMRYRGNDKRGSGVAPTRDLNPKK